MWSAQRAHSARTVHGPGSGGGFALSSGPPYASGPVCHVTPGEDGSQDLGGANLLAASDQARPGAGLGSARTVPLGTHLDGHGAHSLLAPGQRAPEEETGVSVLGKQGWPGRGPGSVGAPALPAGGRAPEGQRPARLLGAVPSSVSGQPEKAGSGIPPPGSPRHSDSTCPLRTAVLGHCWPWPGCACAAAGALVGAGPAPSPSQVCPGPTPAILAPRLRLFGDPVVPVFVL